MFSLPIVLGLCSLVPSEDTKAQERGGLEVFWAHVTLGPATWTRSPRKRVGRKILVANVVLPFFLKWFQRHRCAEKGDALFSSRGCC